MPHVLVENVSVKFRVYHDHSPSIKDKFANILRRKSYGGYSDFWAVNDVSLEISDSYMQLQKGTDTVLVSAFQQNIDTSLLSKSLTLPNGLTLKYGDVKDSQTGYIPFIATVDGHKYTFLATSSDILLNMFEE